MQHLDYFNLFWGVLLLVLGLPGTIFARQFQAGHGTTVFSPTRLDRVIVGILMLVVSFEFIYAGVGSPLALRQVDVVAKSLLDVFFIIVAIVVTVGALRRLFRGTQISKQQKLKEIVFIVLFVGLSPIAVVDLINRLRHP